MGDAMGVGTSTFLLTLMNTPATSYPASSTSSASLTPPGSDGVTSISPRPMGRPSGFSEEVGRLCEVIRRRGLSDAQAALSVGVSRATLGRWKRDHEELEDWLAMAREQYRDAKLAIVDEAKTADGRPECRAAVWALEKAFPEDYGRRATAAPSAPTVAPRSSLSTWPDETLEEWEARNMTPEFKELVRLANEEEERLAREEALAEQ
jgi:hypothetical protein